MSSSVFEPAASHASFISLAEQPAAPTGGIASRTFLQTTGGKSLVFSLDVGQEMSEHTNPNHAILCGLTGALTVTAGESTHQLNPGDMLHLPPRLPHAVYAPAAASFLLQLLTPNSST